MKNFNVYVEFDSLTDVIVVEALCARDAELLVSSSLMVEDFRICDVVASHDDDFFNASDFEEVELPF